MGDRPQQRGVRAGLLLAGALAAICGCAEESDPYRALPRLVGHRDIPDAQPTRLQVVGDTLFVAFRGLTRIDKYDFGLRRLGTLELQAPEPVRPTAFALTDTSIVVADHGRGVVAVFDRGGRYQHSFDRLPDGRTRLQPIGLTVHRGVAYVADMGSRRVLAISLNDMPGVTESGELVLSFPGGEVPAGSFPSAVQVTPDGRLLIGDAGRGEVAVHTCEGSRVYGFASVPGLTELAPHGFAADRLRDPALQDDSSFDPSGVRAQGRWHMIDGLNGRIHLFNPLGAYLGTYPTDARLAGPAGIAATPDGQLVFVADPPTNRLLVFSTKEE